MNQLLTRRGSSDFKAGDPVIVLYDGRFNGANGRFVSAREGGEWADIEERNGIVQQHPIRWLRHLDDPSLKPPTLPK